MISLSYIQKKVFKSEESEKVYKNIFWLLQGKLLNYLINFFVGIYTIKRLGPDNYGLFAYCYALTSLFITLSGFGIREIIIRELVKNKDDSTSILNSGVTIVFGLACISIVFNIFIVYLLNQHDLHVVLINLILCIALLFVPFNVVGYLFDSILQSKKVVRVSNLALFFSGLLKVVCVTFSQKLYYYAFATIAENVFVCIGLLYIYRRDFEGKVRFYWNKIVIIPLIKDSWPLAISSMAVWFYMRVDQIMIRQLSTDREAGIYAAGVRLIEMLYVIPMVIQSSFLPKLVELYKVSEEAFLEQLGKIFRFIAILSYVIIIVYLINIGWIIRVFLGAKFAETISICRLLICIFLFVAFGVIRTMYIYTVNISKVRLKITVISCVLNIGLNFLLIPKYGAIGSVIAIMITQFFSSYFSSYLFKDLRKTVKLMNNAIFLVK
jgi:O-antigen/teichoic acid export membrane protein